MKQIRTWLAVLVVLAFLLVPVYAWIANDIYSLTLFGRILVFSLAALGLNLALGFGGMVSLGHAMYIGLGLIRSLFCPHWGFMPAGCICWWRLA